MVLRAVESVVTRLSHSVLCRSCDEQKQGVQPGTFVRPTRVSAHDPARGERQGFASDRHTRSWTSPPRLSPRWQDTWRSLPRPARVSSDAAQWPEIINQQMELVRFQGHTWHCAAGGGRGWIMG